jgi:hypothetical protein
MVYDVPHRITTLLRSRHLPAVHQDFKQLVLGRCLESGVRHFMTSFGIKNEGGRLCFARRERAKLYEAAARLIINQEPPAEQLVGLSISVDAERVTKKQRLELFPAVPVGISAVPAILVDDGGPVVDAGVPAVNPMDDSELKKQWEDYQELTSRSEVTEVKATSKATRADDARVAVESWDERLVVGLGLALNEDTAKAARVLRDWWSLKFWKRRQT